MIIFLNQILIHMCLYASCVCMFVFFILHLHVFGCRDFLITSSAVRRAMPFRWMFYDNVNCHYSVHAYSSVMLFTFTSLNFLLSILMGQCYDGMCLMNLLWWNLFSYQLSTQSEPYAITVVVDSYVWRDCFWLLIIVSYVSLSLATSN